jgi:hypothetical protein
VHFLDHVRDIIHIDSIGNIIGIFVTLIIGIIRMAILMKGPPDRWKRIKNSRLTNRNIIEASISWAVPPMSQLKPNTRVPAEAKRVWKEISIKATLKGDR